jgi:hypothetical protein
MKLESRMGNKCVYVDFFNGREIRATTVNGPLGAEKIFAIIRAQNGVARTPGMTQDLTVTRDGQ